MVASGAGEIVVVRYETWLSPPDYGSRKDGSPAGRVDPWNLYRT